VEYKNGIQDFMKQNIKLNKWNFTDLEDMAMVAQIKAEVWKLSNCNDICNSVFVLEKDEQLEENTKRMIYMSSTPKTPQQIADDAAVSFSFYHWKTAGVLSISFARYYIAVIVNVCMTFINYSSIN